MPQPREIKVLLSRIARRYDGFLLRRIALFTLSITSFFLIGCALYWVIRGHAVPWFIPLCIASLGLIAGLFYYFKKRTSVATAAAHTDAHFQLKDGIQTARYLAEVAPEEESTKRQWQWLQPKLNQCDPRSIVRPINLRNLALTLLITGTAITLCCLPASDSVLAAIAQAEETRAQVAESKEELQELIKDIEQELAQEGDEAAVEMDELRKMVDKIDETGDRTEAARQFARIEQKVRDQSKALNQKRDEETLKMAAKELAKSQDTETRKLGKKLAQLELKEAAELLKKLGKQKFDPKKLSKDSKAKRSEAELALKDLQKLREATKRMAAAGKQRQAANQANGKQNAKNNGQKNGKFADADLDQQALEDMLAELDEAAEELEEALEEFEMDPDAEWNEDMDELQKKLARMRGKLGKRFKKMQGKRLARSKLNALQRALGKAQGSPQQQAAQKGGKKPGVGSSEQKRQERDNSQDNGSLAELKGQHGSGPSLSTVEDTNSGSGSSHLRGTAKKRDFARQMESFVERDDIPESLKLGVRNYFESLQSTEEK